MNPTNPTNPTNSTNPTQPIKPTRLDIALVERGLVKSRQRARAMILAGKVLVHQMPATKAGLRIVPEDPISLKGADMPFVSRGGLKLEKAFETFGLDVEDRICMDVGASTGGFTDCLLQHGARRVYSIDVGYGQLAWSLRQDPRVVVIERTNVRYLRPAQVPCPVDFIAVDVSFISLKKVVPGLLPFGRKGTDMVVLIKPQFEVGRQHVGKGGVVRDPALHEALCSDLSSFFSDSGLTVGPAIASPIKGPKGNREFLMRLRMI